MHINTQTSLGYFIDLCDHFENELYDVIAETDSCLNDCFLTIMLLLLVCVTSTIRGRGGGIYAYVHSNLFSSVTASSYAICCSRRNTYQSRSGNLVYLNFSELCIFHRKLYIFPISKMYLQRSSIPIRTSSLLET